VFSRALALTRVLSCCLGLSPLSPIPTVVLKNGGNALQLALNFLKCNFTEGLGGGGGGGGGGSSATAAGEGGGGGAQGAASSGAVRLVDPIDYVPSRVQCMDKQAVRRGALLARAPSLAPSLALSLSHSLSLICGLKPTFARLHTRNNAHLRVKTLISLLPSF
jgi:hypothetical protein